jgi:hypothetical protein
VGNPVQPAVSSIRYRERLNAGIGLYLGCALVIPAGLAVFLPINVIAGVVAALVLYAIAVVFLIATARTIEVTADTFRAGKAALPLRYVGATRVYRGDDAFIARGRDLDARAYVLLRGSVRDVVRVQNTDPDDPAPYWLVSSRHPERLAAALAK